MTPYVLIDATRPGLDIPTSHVRDGKIVLNIGPNAVRTLNIDNDRMTFSARFNGVGRDVLVPVIAVQAIYAHENGKGMVFPDDPREPESTPPASSPPGTPKRPGLKIVK